MANTEIKVWFNDGSIRYFRGFWKQVLKDIDLYCEVYQLETVSAEWA